MFLASCTVSYATFQVLTLYNQEAEARVSRINLFLCYLLHEALKTAPTWSSVLLFIGSVIALIGCCQNRCFKRNILA